MPNKKKTILMNAFNLIKQTPDKELNKYGIEVYPLEGKTDHDLLVNLTKKVDSDHEILMTLVKEVKAINARIDNLVAKNNLKE